MVSKKELLKNLSNYSAEEIAEAVRSGDVSLYELSKETQGAFTPLLKKKVQYLVENPNLPVKEFQETIQEPEDIISNVEMHTSEPETISSYRQNETSRYMETNTSELEVTLQENYDDQIIDSDEIATEQNVATIDNRGMFMRPFSFKGRIRRLEYWLSRIIYIVINCFVTLISIIGEDGTDTLMFIANFVYYIICLFLLWFLIAQGCKRCHDRGNSGWYQIIPFYVLVMLFGDSDEGENEYGSNPKE